MSDMAGRLANVLARPWVDRLVALVAVAPFGYELYLELVADQRSLPRIAEVLQLSAIILPMLVRRPARRVTANPLFWALTFVATYWGLGTLQLYDAGRQLVSDHVSDAVAVLSLVVALWARWSLGRNIGLVPAERRLVTTGAYAWVRHPIYTGVFLTLLSLELDSFSARNLLLDLVSASLWVTKTFVEESFLRRNPDYSAYMQRVRWRWVPGIA